MKKKYNLLIILLILSVHSYCAVEKSRQKEIYKAFISGNMKQWASIVVAMENDTQIKTLQQKLELVEYYYGLCAYYIGQKNEKQAKVIIHKADALLEQLLKVAPRNAEVNAFKGSFMAYKISLDTYKILTLGPESLKYINLAYKLDPMDIQSMTDKGNALYNAPKMFGGNKPESIILFQKSISQMEKANLDTVNWFYLNTLVLLARAYIHTDQPEKAKAIYEKALNKEPEFLWVKIKLYPELIKTL